MDRAVSTSGSVMASAARRTTLANPFSARSSTTRRHHCGRSAPAALGRTPASHRPVEPSPPASVRDGTTAGQRRGRTSSRTSRRHSHRRRPDGFGLHRGPPVRTRPLRDRHEGGRTSGRHTCELDPVRRLLLTEDRRHHPPTGTARGTVPGDVQVIGGDRQVDPRVGNTPRTGGVPGTHTPPSCRAGACGTCATTIHGRTAYLVDPLVEPRDGQVLLCCSVPAADLVVDEN